MNYLREDGEGKTKGPRSLWEHLRGPSLGTRRRTRLGRADRDETTLVL